MCLPEASWSVVWLMKWIYVTGIQGSDCKSCRRDGDTGLGFRERRRPSSWPGWVPLGGWGLPLLPASSRLLKLICGVEPTKRPKIDELS